MSTRARPRPVSSALLGASVIGASTIFVGQVSAHAWFTLVLPTVVVLGMGETLLTRVGNWRLALVAGVLAALGAGVFLRILAGQFDGSVGRAVAVSGGIAALAFSLKAVNRPGLAVLPGLLLVLLAGELQFRVLVPGLSALLCLVFGALFVLSASESAGSRRVVAWLGALVAGALLLAGFVPLWVSADGHSQQTWLVAPIATVVDAAPTGEAAGPTGTQGANTGSAAIDSAIGAGKSKELLTAASTLVPSRGPGSVWAWWLMLLVAGIVLSVRLIRFQHLMRRLNRGSLERRLVGAWIWFARRSRSHKSSISSGGSGKSDSLRAGAIRAAYAQKPSITIAEVVAAWELATRKRFSQK